MFSRLDARVFRLASRDPSLNKLAKRSHQYRDRNTAERYMILAPQVSSEERDYIPTDLKTAEAVTNNQAFALYDSPLWNMALIASRLHLVWIATVCGKLETRYRYSNTLGWNTFPVPMLTEQNKADLTRCSDESKRKCGFKGNLRFADNTPFYRLNDQSGELSFPVDQMNRCSSGQMTD